MAMRYLAGKLRVPAALRRPAASGSRSLSANAPSRDIEEAVRYNRFHRKCIMGSVVAGIGLGGLLCVRYARSYRKALREHFGNLEIVHLPPSRD